MLALIPARSGSKGLPDKNTLLLKNKPLIAYTIQAALASSAISRVVVNTDCQRIAEIAIEFGAEVPYLRSALLAKDDSKAIDVYKDAICRLKDFGFRQINSLCVLLPTCPLRTHLDIDNACGLFNETGVNSVVSYTKANHPIEWHKHIDAQLNLKEVPGFLDTQNRQCYKETFYPNGAIYIFKTKLLMSNAYYDHTSKAYIMPQERSLDIDTAWDFELVEKILTKANND